MFSELLPVLHDYECFDSFSFRCLACAYRPHLVKPPCKRPTPIYDIPLIDLLVGDSYLIEGYYAKAYTF
ncbi:hypothetical protein SAMN02745729_1318 [Marinobacterium iners DSM 11526]|uniref:Uncharacterized protein n=1 Tax=Marinobacterium iners DSM 11526 TaxID=1122198 RepID=A0A1H4H7G8_9GAMM|nr:hypothetical protein SAMN02745729_1318 [Marinobacterium iners DSM 11526]